MKSKVELNISNDVYNQAWDLFFGKMLILRGFRFIILFYFLKQELNLEPDRNLKN